MAALAGVIALVLVFRYWNAANYPGALLISDHSIYDLGLPNLTVRRDTSYRTGDAFPDVYNWYSNGFGLGPEAQAHGGCILLANAATSMWVIERHMSVTLCDTPKGRMIFVMRSVILRPPR